MSLRRNCTFLGVVDTGVLRVDWDGQPREVRLMDVDPESGTPGGPKPATEFGRRTLKWARETFFLDINEVTLEFPSNDILLSNSGRLLCYLNVRGENYNVRLVREGWSPLFQKYGHSPTHREELEEAEFWARMEGRGIWGGLGGRCDYPSLRTYWHLRAGQVTGYRLATAMGEDILSCRFDHRAIIDLARTETWAHVFGDLVRSFHMPNGGVRMQVGSPSLPLTAFFPPTARALSGFIEREFIGFAKPNYVYLEGPLSLVDGAPQLLIEHQNQITTCPPDNLK